MPISRRRRSVLAVAGSVAVTAGVLSAVAVNAYADEPFVDLSVAVPSAVTSANTQSKDVRVEVYNYGNATATGVTVEFALPEAADAGAVYVHDDFAESCELNDTATAGTCSIPDVAPGAVVNLRPFTIVPADLGEDGNRRIGKATVSVSSAQPDFDENDNQATFVARVGNKSSVDLVVWPQADIAVRPGDESVVDRSVFTVSNESNVPVQGVEFIVIMPDEVTFTADVEGCEVNGSLANPDDNPSFQITCFWHDVVIGPGEEWSPSDVRALPFRMSPDAPAGVKLDRNALIFAWESGGEEAESSSTLAIESSRPAAGTKDATAGAVGEPDAVAQDNLAELSVYTSEVFADLSITATDAEGTVGETVPVTVTVHNAGPAPAPGGYSVAVMFPEHTAVTSAPEGCIPGDDYATLYICATSDDLAVDDDGELAFDVELLAAPADQWPAFAGVSANDAPDADLGNNEIEFAVTAVEGTDPTTEPTDDPSGEPTDDPSAEPSDDPSSQPGDDDGASDLPITGTSLTLMAGAALLLIVVGTAMLLAARKRRTNES